MNPIKYIFYSERRNGKTFKLAYSHANTEDNSGASVTGVYNGAEFYYEVPGFYLDWWSEEGECELDSKTLYYYRGMDENLLDDMEKYKWNEIEIVVSD